MISIIIFINYIKSVCIIIIIYSIIKVDSQNEKILKINTINKTTFSNAEIDQDKVCINFSKPFKDLTNLKTLITLNILKTLIIWKDFKNAASIPSILAIIKSAIDATTTKKSNLFQPPWKYANP